MRGWPWGFIGGCWLAWLALWIVMALFAKRTIERTARGWSLASSVVLGGVVATFRFQHALSVHQQLYRPTITIGIAAGAVVAGGLAFTAWACFVLGGNWSGDVVFKEGHELIESGPYRFVRHPIYTGLLAMVLGTAIDLASLYGFVGFVLTTALLWGKLRREEQLMSAHFPEAYAAYRRRTRALIPFLV